MKTSVLTLVRNRKTNLVNLMRGLQQSRVQPAELVIVHMNEAPYEELPELPFPVKQVAIESEDPNDRTPLAHSRNTAARNASHELLLFLDVDCIPHPDLVGEMERVQQSNPSLLMGDIRYLPEMSLGKWTYSDLDHYGEAHPARPQVGEGEVLPMENYTLFWSLCFSMYRREFDRMGGFDEDYVGYGAEDTDFAFRARTHDIPFAIVGAKAYHQYHHVYRPPLHNFRSIVKNANTFQQKWDRWAMEKWLGEFVESGHVAWEEASKAPAQILREPTEAEILANRKTDGRGF